MLAHVCFKLCCLLAQYAVESVCLVRAAGDGRGLQNHKVLAVAVPPADPVLAAGHVGHLVRADVREDAATAAAPVLA